MSYPFSKLLALLFAATALLLCSACTVSELSDMGELQVSPVPGDSSEIPAATVNNQPTAASASEPDPVPASVSSPESLSRELFERVNAYRKSRGLRQLKWNDDMAGVAAAHSRTMSSRGEFSHRGFNKRANSLRRKGVLTVSENLAYYRGRADSADVALQLWIDSPAHYKNLSGKKYTMTGVGCGINSRGCVYFVQLYGR